MLPKTKSLFSFDHVIPFYLNAVMNVYIFTVFFPPLLLPTSQWLEGEISSVSAAVLIHRCPLIFKNQTSDVLVSTFLNKCAKAESSADLLHLTD